MVKKPFSRLLAIITGTRSPESDDPLTTESSLSRLEKFAHFVALLWQSFVRNRCLVHAASLSFTTLLALVPMLAVALGVTSSLLKTQDENAIYVFVDKAVASIMPPGVVNTNAPGQPVRVSRVTDAKSLETNLPSLSPTEATNLLQSVTGTNAPTGTNLVVVTAADTRVVTAQKEAANYIHGFIQNTNSTALGTTGMFLLIIVAIRMLSNVEATFNDIWGVPRGRSWLVRIRDYWFVITFGPLLLAFAIGLSSGPHFQGTRDMVNGMPVIGGFVFSLLPLVVLWLTFALVYQMVPNTKVHFRAAIVGGIIGGTLWHLNNVFGFLYVSRLVTNSKIYGALGLLPVFMLGVYFSWAILLFGAQVAYAFQNRVAYRQDKLAENVDQRGREFIAFRLMTSIGHRFQHGLPPVTVPELSQELGISSKLVQQVLRLLISARLVMEISRPEPAYAPARPLDTINAHHILMALRATAGQELAINNEPARAEVYGEFARIQEAEKQAAISVTMLDLVTRTQARTQLPSTARPTLPAASETAPAFVYTTPETVTGVTTLTPAQPTVNLAPAPPMASASADDDNSFPL